MRGLAARRQQDEEETAALVPTPPAPAQPSSQAEDAAPPPCHDDDSTGSKPPVVDHAEQGQPTAKPWERLLPTRGVGMATGGLVVLALLLVGSTSSGWSYLDSSPSALGSSIISGLAGHGRRGRPPHHTSSPGQPRVPIPFNCGNVTFSQLPTCSSAATPPSAAMSSEPRRAPEPAPACPEYFRYIHSDLSPWRKSGITREALERARDRATFRLVVVGGRAYVEKLHPAFQTRDVFTQWGILQLLARYPGRVPDLDLMFFCGDIPRVRVANFPDPSAAPPIFMYCKDENAINILFPDWTFWGWPEVNIRPWAPFVEEEAHENRRVPWPERKPYAYWKGNPDVASVRKDLMRCNASSKGGKDWNARLFRQDWKRANRNGFKDSNLAKQCLYRYKIYVQGRGWSVSEKYILACDSPMLHISTPYRDFFSRGLVAGRHYWPIDAARKCPSIKFAVDWGNAHPALAQQLGEEGSAFAREELSMDYVYDYMLHLLTLYAGLLRYEPTVPKNAVELSLETMACPARGRARKFMMESMEKYVADYEPCALPPPFTAKEAREIAQRDLVVRSKVKKMEETWR
ncbi:hypothetical protein ACP70R_034587 [Stipagrostis hirtigluma subsp. patula]